MTKLKTTAIYMGVLVLLFAVLEAVVFFAFVLPFREDEFAGVTNLLLLYMVVPCIVFSVGLAMGGFHYEYSIAHKKVNALFVSVCMFVLSIVLVPFALFGIFNVVV